MLNDRMHGRLRVYMRIAIGSLGLLLAVVQSGCSPYDKFDEVETKVVIEELTGCTVPNQAYEMRGFSYDMRGQGVYAAFRIPQEASSDLFAAFQGEGVEVVTFPFQDPCLIFVRGHTLQGEAGVNLFDSDLLSALSGGDLQVTGSARSLRFSQASPQRFWQIIIFEDTGIVYFAAAVNQYD